MVLVPLAVCFIVSFDSSKAALLTPLAFLPTALFYYVWVRQCQHMPARRAYLNGLIWIYVLMGSLGTIVLSIAQLSAHFLTVSFLLGDAAPAYWIEFLRGTAEGLTHEERMRRADMAATWQNWVLMLLFSYVMAGGMEEILKYMPILYARRQCNKHKACRREPMYIDFSIAGGLGLVTVECIGYIVDTCHSGLPGWVAPLVTLAQRQVAGTMGHVVVSLLTSYRAARADRRTLSSSWFRILLPAFVLHGSAIMAVFVACTVQGHVGWVHPTEVISIIGLYGNYFLVVLLTGLLAWHERHALHRESEGIKQA